MSPLEYIKEGIQNGNWETVCEGYERLTGEAVPLPLDNDDVKVLEKALRKIANIIAERQVTSAKDDDSPPVEFNQTTKSKKKKPGRPKGSGRKGVKKKTTVDKDGKDSSLLLRDSDKTIVQKSVGTTQLITNDPDPKEVAANKARAARANKNKLKLKREAATTYKVECNECSNSFQSTRPKGEMGQKCPKCLGGLKR